MIVETLNENFEYLCVVDTEFKGDQDKGEINDPICVVIKELKSGQVHRFSGPKLKLPYPANKTLWIAHNVIAEAQTFLSYGIKLPKYWWDRCEHFRINGKALICRKCHETIKNS